MIPWSYSSLLNFEACPHRTKLQKIDKIPDNLDKNPIIKDGSDKHKELEDFMIAYKQDKNPDLPKCAKKIDKYLERIFDVYSKDELHPEIKFAFDKDFTLLDSWTHPDIWMRAVIDLFAHSNDQAHIVDYKSGKYNPYASFRNMGQLQLYAVIALVSIPSLELVTTQLMYLKDGKLIEKNYYRSKLPSLMESFVERGNKMFYAEEFPAKPSKSNCKYCPYKEGNVCDYATD